MVSATIPLVAELSAAYAGMGTVYLRRCYYNGFRGRNRYKSLLAPILMGDRSEGTNRTAAPHAGILPSRGSGRGSPRHASPPEHTAHTANIPGESFLLARGLGAAIGLVAYREIHAGLTGGDRAPAPRGSPAPPKLCRFHPPCCPASPPRPAPRPPCLLPRSPRAHCSDPPVAA